MSYDKKNLIDFNLPLVTVVTVVYNSVEFIENTIQSVINQIYPRLEYIIIDGGSTDGTLDIIKKYDSKISLWLIESDNGIYDAMNNAIDLANGEWICFMNSGDFFFSSNVLFDVFNSDRIYGDIIYGNTQVNDLYKTFVIHLNDNLDIFDPHISICHQSSFVKASVYRYLKFDLRYKIAADFDFFCRAYNHKFVFQFFNVIIASYLSGGFSSKNVLLMYQEKRKICKKCSNFKKKIKLYLYYSYLMFMNKFKIYSF